MNTIFSLIVTLGALYVTSIFFICALCRLPSKEARDKVNSAIMSFFHSSEPDYAVADIYFFEKYEWMELTNILENYFHRASFAGGKDNNDGTLSIAFNTSGIKPCYQDLPNVLKQSLSFDINNWLLRKTGTETPFHFRSCTEEYVLVLFAYNKNGLQKLATIQNAIARQTQQQLSRKKPCCPFHFSTDNSPYIYLGFKLAEWYGQNQRIPIRVSLRKTPHWLITGSSGSGKSYLLTFILLQLLNKPKLCTVWFCDFKNSTDFRFLNGYQHYATGNDVYDTILEYYNLFEQAREGILYPACSQLLVIDEYPSFLQYLASDKKSLDNVKRIISMLLMLGRDINGISFGLILTCQRPDSALFQSGTGARDNFMLRLALGNLSAEGKAMISDSPSELPDTIYQQGEGIVGIDGRGIEELLVPEITNLSKTCEMFSSSLTPPSPASPPPVP